MDIFESSFLACEQGSWRRVDCRRDETFIQGACRRPQTRYKRQGISGSGRVGDFCSFNTDCLTVSAGWAG